MHVNGCRKHVNIELFSQESAKEDFCTINQSEAGLE